MTLNKRAKGEFLKAMDIKEFLEIMASGAKVTAGSEVHSYMVKLSNDAMRVTARLNAGYHEPEEVPASSPS